MVNDEILEEDKEKVLALALQLYRQKEIAEICEMSNERVRFIINK